MIWQWLTVLSILIIAAFYDIKRKEVPLRLCTLAIIVSMLLWFLFIRDSVIDLLFCFLPGIFFFLISFISREQIGYGDDLIIIFIGEVLGLKNVVLVIVFAFLFSAITSLFLLLIKKRGKKTTIPFIPFILLGTIGAGIF